MAASSADSIVIVGAGIIGLDVALVLCKRGLGRCITVVAEYLPGDTAPSYTSPWAGCNFSGISGGDANALRWDELGYAHLTNLATHHATESFVSLTQSMEYWDANPPHDKINSMSEYLKDFKIIPRQLLPQGVEYGICCTSVTVNAPKHLAYLHGLLKDHYGVRFLRQKLPGIQAAYASPRTKVVFNCTGNAARTLPGVQDAKCFPTRGQVVLARAPLMRCNVMRHGRDYETYVIPRPQSNGNVILGGFMQKGNRQVCSTVHSVSLFVLMMSHFFLGARSDPSTYGHEADSIISRTKDLCPRELRDGPCEMLAAFAGARPSRHGGARVEREPISVGGSDRVLVHNYGAGGSGFQAGYGMALDAVACVDDVVKELEREVGRAKM
ncbi:NAD(P)-binding domain protein [Metarhizium album ARSEF 1941]|uniref:NAD(P)-binding domain protein n=1 Tax=Metarhizium album (strain ARSEF 1941) TaxID=1081103 RepID=A0A0B2WMX7_METAS|nr:NAD(P)-binding domain protein [Metarhizium album ARSEF 1941]KHN94842.1 NAD(P)-binding domain protein [Metarhizium album ARSEF 1941]